MPLWSKLCELRATDVSAAGVTQKPIGPGDTFTYEFVTDAPGTYWYHSHIGTQYVDGIRGAIIVGGDPSDAVIQLYDW